MTTQSDFTLRQTIGLWLLIIPLWFIMMLVFPVFLAAFIFGKIFDLGPQMSLWEFIRGWVRLEFIGG